MGGLLTLALTVRGGGSGVTEPDWAIDSQDNIQICDERTNHHHLVQCDLSFYQRRLAPSLAGLRARGLLYFYGFELQRPVCS